MEVRGQFSGVDFLFPPCRLQDQNHLIRFGSKYLYSRSHFDGPLTHINMLSVQTNVISNVSFVSVKRHFGILKGSH